MAAGKRNVNGTGEQPPRGPWKFVKLGLRLAFGVALVALMARSDRASGLWGRVASVSPWVAAGGVGSYMVCQAIAAFRWRYTIAIVARRVSMWRCLGLYYVGMFFSLFLPTGIGGDVVRAAGLARDVGSLSLSAASVFVDRNVGLGAALAFGLAASVVHVSMTPDATVLGWSVPSVPTSLVFCLLIIGYAVANIMLFSVRLFEWGERICMRAGAGSVAAHGRRLHEALIAYRRQGPKLAVSFALSLAYHSAECGFVYFLARGIGIAPAPVVVFYLLPLVGVAALLPVSVGNLGLREGLFAYVLAAEGIGMSEAIALALVYFGVQLACGAIGGVWFWIGGMDAGRGTPGGSEQGRGGEPHGNCADIRAEHPEAREGAGE